MKGTTGDAFEYSDFTTAQIIALKIKGDTGDSAYQYAVDGGYTGTEADFEEQAALIGDAVKLNVNEYVDQTDIDPLQGRYTSFTTPKDDRTIKFSGTLASIGTNNFMIEYVGAMENGDPVSPFLQLDLGVTPNNLDISGGFNGANKVYSLKYGSLRNYPSNAVKPIGKPIHVVMCKLDSDYFTMLDGVRYNAPNTTVFNIANTLVTLSNASNCSLLRKFNFADEAYAKSLYNGGRWMDKAIGAEDRGVNPLRMLQDEFLRTSICSNGTWINTANGNNLVATNNDEITYNTGQVVDQYLNGSGAPTFAPDMIGQQYIDTTNKVTYTAYGTTSANNWE